MRLRCASIHLQLVSSRLDIHVQEVKFDDMAHWDSKVVPGCGTATEDK
jgi:hypothetical protein